MWHIDPANKKHMTVGTYTCLGILLKYMFYMRFTCGWYMLHMCLVYVARVVGICCTCVSHTLNMCFLSAVSLGYVYVPPHQAPIEGSPESFSDSAKFFQIAA